ncbi:MAG: hypothetical protein AB1Z98_08130 [Nannocystaceae bacterium]
MAYTSTTTRTATVAATEARVRSVLRQVRVDLMAASRNSLEATRLEQWIDDLSYMLQSNALKNFEIRISQSSKVLRAWQYEVTDDGHVLGGGGNGGGIDAYGLPTGATTQLVVTKRQPLPTEVFNEIQRRGWTNSVQALQGTLVRERVYEKDGYGVIRHRFDLG